MTFTIVALSTTRVGVGGCGEGFGGYIEDYQYNLKLKFELSRTIHSATKCVCRHSFLVSNTLLDSLGLHPLA